MSEVEEDGFDIPDPDHALKERRFDISAIDPGGDDPLPAQPSEFAEDPRYDPGGMGGQPDVAEEGETHNA